MTPGEIARRLERAADAKNAVDPALLREAAAALRVSREDVRAALASCDLDELLPDWPRPTGTGGGLERLTRAVLWEIETRRGFKPGAT